MKAQIRDLFENVDELEKLLRKYEISDTQGLLRELILFINIELECLYDEGKVDGYDEGYEQGVFEAQCAHQHEADDAYMKGYDDGFKDAESEIESSD